jgi:Reverse transcriptase (RNA-dependent DNA polymerase)
MRQNREITKRKTCIMVKGFSQVPGLHFNEMYAPVMCWETLHILLALGAIYGLEIHQFDVKSAYLHGVIQEKVWVEQPDGFKMLGKEHLPMRLKKALYGTKQGGNQWRKTLEEFMMKILSWCCSQYDRAVFYKRWDNGTWGIVGFWVDNATSIGHKTQVSQLEDTFQKQFRISGQSDAHWILGSGITRDVNSPYINISQKHYIQDIAAKFYMQNSKPIQTPIPLGIDLTSIPNGDHDKEEMKKIPYRELIGSLMFAATVSRPDIAHAVNKLAQYTSNPNRIHWTLAKRILQFLYHTRDWSLKLGGKSPSLYAYSDADFAGDTGDRKSTGGHAIFLGNGAISWSSKKQSVVALSSTESEYIQLSETTREILWTRRLLQELGLSLDLPTTLYEDNLGTIDFAENQKALRRMKHIDVKFHFVKSHVDDKTIDIKYKPTAEMTADIFTKFLSPHIYHYHAKSLGLSPSTFEGECRETNVE